MYKSKVASCVLQSGSCAFAKADVIVNTTSASLNLNNGMVSAVLSKAAGPGMQNECTNYVQSRGNIAVGDFAPTGGHNLSCRNVYHCVGGPFAGGSGSQVRVC